MKYHIKHKTPIVEDEGTQQETQTTETTANANAEKAMNLRKQIAELNNQKLQARTDYENKRKTIEANQNALETQLAEMNENVDTDIIEESLETKFSKRLFESLKGNVIASMADAIESAMYEEKVSCPIYRGSIDYVARTFNDALKSNMQSWNGDNHWNDAVVILLNILDKNRNVSLSEDETNRVVKNLENKLKENKLFSWIFGNVQEKEGAYTAAKQNRSHGTSDTTLTVTGDELSAIEDYFGNDYADEVDEISDDTYVLHFGYPQYKDDVVKFLNEIEK